ncbi:hypothetical protein D4764_10G0009570 [Takifugu flavidus]|uniref:Uncharacterized protein n=1 Tax=Takifugu flavidus TaxID=433684 RepID=A0A5C6PNM3_9TELE|nr:hypothetical protein D4764_10G0009570 [Takifugu flavidus]
MKKEPMEDPVGSGPGRLPQQLRISRTGVTDPSGPIRTHQDLSGPKGLKRTQQDPTGPIRTQQDLSGPIRA